MKKLLILFVLSLFMVLGQNEAFAQGDILNIRGNVTSIHKDFVVIQDAANPKKSVQVLALGTTYIIDNATATSKGKETIKVGDFVSAFYGPQMTKSLPPQAKGILLVVGEESSTPAYLRVSRVEQDNDEVKVHYDNKIMHISKAAMKANHVIRTGDEVLAWYSLAASESPTELAASRAILLNRAAQDIVINKKDNTIIVRGKKAPLEIKAYSLNGEYYLPVRAIAEDLGYTVKWNGDTRYIDVLKGVQSASLQVGSTDYGEGKVRVVLNRAPRIVNGNTVAPLAFFTEILNLEVETK